MFKYVYIDICLNTYILTFMKENYKITYSKFTNEKQMFDFISQYNNKIDTCTTVIKRQEEIIDVLRENIRDLIKVVGSQRDATDLTDKLMEKDFITFKNLLKEADSGEF